MKIAPKIGRSGTARPLRWVSPSRPHVAPLLSPRLTRGPHPRRLPTVKTITALVALVALGTLATGSIGCSSSSEKQDVDTSSALTELRTPTGSFSDDTAGSAFGNYRATKTDS